jgi:hypothetical protein
MSTFQLIPRDEALYASISLNGFRSRTSIFAISAPRYDASRTSLVGHPPRL